jgi:hypothetical protein
MRNLLTVAGIVALFGIASAVQASDDGIKHSDLPSDPGQYSPADGALVEAWNDNGAPGAGGTYLSPCFAFQYTPSTSYVLEKIEWYAGNLQGTVSTTVRSGGINGPDLTTTGPYTESPPRDWQGVNLTPPIAVTAGNTYGIIYRIVVGAQISAATTGIGINHWHDPTGSCSSFNGPFSSTFWRARFYGSFATPTEPSTWGNIKSFYR